MTNTKILIKGGVNPPDDRAISGAAAIMNAAVPSVAVIPLLQHAGRPARCVVTPGTSCGKECSSARRTASTRRTCTPPFREPCARCGASPPTKGGLRRRSSSSWGASSRSQARGKGRVPGRISPGGTCWPGSTRGAWWGSAVTSFPLISSSVSAAGVKAISPGGQRGRLRAFPQRGFRPDAGEAEGDRGGVAHLPRP